MVTISTGIRRSRRIRYGRHAVHEYSKPGQAYGLVWKMNVQKGCDEAHPSMGTYVCVMCGSVDNVRFYR
jgi:hypothetical protein